MEDKEKTYLSNIEKAIEAFGAIQRNFVLDKTGIRAIIRFIEDLDGRRPFFELDDPVVQKGKTATEKVITELSNQLKVLKKVDPPVDWKNFHTSLINSVERQIDGYKEMTQVFEDSDLDHIMEGQALVNEGMRMLETNNA